MHFLPYHPILLAAVLLASTVSAQAGVIAASITRDNDNFQSLLRESMEKAAEQRGHQIYVGDAEDNSELQLQQIQHYVNEDVDALIIILVDSKAEYVQKVVDLAASKKIPLVLLNRAPDLTPLPDRVVFVGSNDNEAGTLEMEELARLADYKGKVALIRGPDNHPAAMARTQMVREVVGKYPDMSIEVEDTALWRRNTALTKTLEWLQAGKEFRIVAANNDEMALGAIMAIHEAGKNPADYLIGGIDATRDALQAMADNQLDVTVLQDARGQGHGAVTAVVEMLYGEKQESRIMIPYRLVTPQNYQRFMY